MIAIRISGMALRRGSARTPHSGSATAPSSTSARACTTSRKHEKMNVSLSRKIHIIALPQGTAKACLSAAKSVTTPGILPPRRRLDRTRHDLDRHRRLHPSRSGDQQQAEEDEPDGQQVVPVDGAQLRRSGVSRRARRGRADMRATSSPRRTGRRAGAGRAVRSARRRTRSPDWSTRNSPPPAATARPATGPAGTRARTRRPRAGPGRRVNVPASHRAARQLHARRCPPAAAAC